MSYQDSGVERESFLKTLSATPLTYKNKEVGLVMHEHKMPAQY